MILDGPASSVAWVQSCVRRYGDDALRVDHIGSTSVQGLAAKPIIDVQVSVTSLEPIGAYRLPLEGLGFNLQSR